MLSNEPLKRVSVPLSPKNVDNSLPFCNTNPNEPVEVDEPLMLPAAVYYYQKLKHLENVVPATVPKNPDHLLDADIT